MQKTTKRPQIHERKKRASTLAGIRDGSTIQARGPQHNTATHSHAGRNRRRARKLNQSTRPPANEYAKAGTSSRRVQNQGARAPLREFEHGLDSMFLHDTDTVTICTRMLTHLNDALDPSTDATDLLTSMTAMLPAQSDEGVDAQA